MTTIEELTTLIRYSVYTPWKTIPWTLDTTSLGRGAYTLPEGPGQTRVVRAFGSISVLWSSFDSIPDTPCMEYMPTLTPQTTPM